MSKRILSLLLALCLLSGCIKAEEAPVEIPQEPMQETQSQEKEESEKIGDGSNRQRIQA